LPNSIVSKWNRFKATPLTKGRLIQGFSTHRRARIYSFRQELLERTLWTLTPNSNFPGISRGISHTHGRSHYGTLGPAFFQPTAATLNTPGAGFNLVRQLCTTRFVGLRNRQFTSVSTFLKTPFPKLLGRDTFGTFQERAIHLRDLLTLAPTPTRRSNPSPPSTGTPLLGQHRPTGHPFSHLEFFTGCSHTRPFLFRRCFSFPKNGDNARGG